jgi:hypothetical protein
MSERQKIIRLIRAVLIMTIAVGAGAVTQTPYWLGGVAVIAALSGVVSWLVMAEET